MVKYSPIRNIIKKEWRLMASDVNSIMILSLIPLAIVGQFILYIWIAHNFSEGIVTNQIFVNSLENLRHSLPSVGGLPLEQQLLVLFLSQSNFYLLLIPTMIAISMATFSIVDEKLSGSLEALLATPVKTWDLLLGKTLSGAILALVVTWFCAGVYVLGVVLLGWGNLLSLVIAPAWFLSLFLLTPGVALLSFLLGVVGSSRAKDTKSAQNTSLLIILPVLAIVAVQITGQVWFTSLLTLALAIIILVVDFILLRVAVSLFQREAIVVKWR
jgi:ABC-2 type transport system permease protein